MQKKTELQKALAKRKQHALQFARERDQWSLRLQQQNNEAHITELDQLRNQLDEVKAELDVEHRAIHSLTSQRDAALHQVQVLKSSPTPTNARREQTHPQTDNTVRHDIRPVVMADNTVRHSVFNQAMIYIGAAFLFIAALFTLIAFQDAQSKVVSERQVGAVALTAMDMARVRVKETKATVSQMPSPASGKRKIQVARSNATEHLQWGPPLLMTDPNAVKPGAVFDPLVKEKQKDLLALGFDLGEVDGFKGLRTIQALEEFTALYLPESSKQQLTDAQLAVVISSYASLARNDASRLGLDRGVVAAIRLSSVRTGVEFAYLMKLAAAESNFKPAIEAESSSATGLYQFTRDTWLNTVKKHGARYGLGQYVTAIEFYVTRSGFQRPMVRDQAVKQHLLDLRKNPRLSAMMVAETVRDNHSKLSFSMNREPSQTDLYLTHFLGTDGAIAFLKALDKTPDVHALKMFPAAAKSNQDIFHQKTTGPRTVDEVYELFGSKFSTTRYDDLALN